MGVSDRPLVPLMRELAALRHRMDGLEAIAVMYQQAEDALCESEVRLRTLVQESLQGILVHRNHQPLFVNQAFATMFGYATPEELLRLETVLSLIAPSDRDRMLAYCDARLRGDVAPPQYEFRGLRQNGMPIWVEVRATVIPWDGAPAILSMHIDITAHKQAEEALARYHLLAEQTRDIILFLRRDGQIVDANQAAILAYGYDRSTLLTMTLSDLHTPTTVPLVAAQLAQAEHSGTRFDTIHQGRDGSPFPVEVRAVGADIGGERLLLHIVRDIRQVHAEIAQRVAEPTATLAAANAALRHAMAEPQRAAVESYRLECDALRAQRFMLLGRLAASVSHAIRNPLGAITRHVDLLESELQQPTPQSSTQIAQWLTEIKTRLTCLDELTQDYLSLVRVRTSQRDLQDLGVAVQAWVADLQGLAAARGVTVRLEGIESLGLVAFHGSTLRWAALNLVQNAFDAMPTGGTLTLAGQGTATQVQLQVRDTGSGIPAELLPQLFEPLYTTKPGGAGLGLYIVQEIVAAHGGQVAVQSAAGQGTSFTITLPRATAEAFARSANPAGLQEGACTSTLCAPTGLTW
jgi:PAS domain S-box-containing protein